MSQKKKEPKVIESTLSVNFYSIYDQHMVINLDVRDRVEKLLSTSIFVQGTPRELDAFTLEVY